MIGSMTRKSECITAVMVLPAARACGAKANSCGANDSASADVQRFQREIGNMQISPDVKLVKAGLFVMHAVRYLGELTCCMAYEIETCTKRQARQSGFGRDRTYTNELPSAPH